ncbi:mitochondrial export translocase Oxa2 [Metarhizium album ARSEF 1941]|uniref:Mitochondrial export translocase Oxa2 n=1 Tax=Metarhizium album (strain ARSEF 1941) TaxID=1081103 RepID=A0A0B2WT17_METAS|nr:mitochondrial export translocase Oxa2 [Metarhizium album ARSEF 1941]KHN99216.1 mitochondrial export translocase Oxa2 [Metarhizium album ARSEF 1941]
MNAFHKSAPGLTLAQLTRVTAARLPSHPVPKPRPSPLLRRHSHLSAVGDAVIFTANSISSIHSAGVPWYLSIPLVALGVNFSLRLPIQYYTRRLVIKRGALNPLVSAWGSRHAASLPRGQGEQAERLWKLRVAGLTEKSRKRIYKTFRVQRWKTLAPFLSMVPFVVVSEALRRLSGAPMGWISHSVGLASTDKVSAALSDASGLFNEELARGGCLWFVDLTAMDPYYALPMLCSALLARTSWARLSKDQLAALLSLDGSPAPRTPVARIQTGVGRALLLVPLFPMLFADLPSAIFLYWATTFALNDVNESILERAIPRQAPRLKMVQRIPPALPYLRPSHADEGKGARSVH